MHLKGYIVGQGLGSKGVDSGFQQPILYLVVVI